MRSINQLAYKRNLAPKLRNNPNLINAYNSPQNEQVHPYKEYVKSVSPMQRPESRKGNFNRTSFNWNQKKNSPQEFPGNNERLMDNNVRFLITRGKSRKKPMVDDCINVNLENYNFNADPMFNTMINLGTKGFKDSNAILRRNSKKEKEAFNNLKAFLESTQKENRAMNKNPSRFIILPPLTQKRLFIEIGRAHV